MKYNHRIIATLLLVAIIAPLFPVPVKAQLPALPGGAISGVNAGIGAIPTVPISNPAIEAKETGISIFGISIPISWDGLAIIIAKKFLERMVDSTVDWINTGFDGNPAYLDDPKQYFADVADGVAVEFIEGSDLGFLCSPFQTQVRLALMKSYVQRNPFQCTLTDVVANIEAFYSDFNQGGWEAWFSMTQNDANNPYGTYLDARVELDSRMASAINIKQEQLDWGRGILSYEVCEGDIQGPPALGQKCPGPSRIITPGAFIEGQMQNVLGTGVRQLELADEFDELIGALLGQLLRESVFSSNGLASAPNVTSANGGGTPIPQASGVDIDGDSINDIIDTDGDSIPDTCIYGGTYPNCTNLSQTAAENSGVVWGYVFSDTNRNGSRDTGEQDLSGISVHLKNTSGDEIGNSSTFNGIYSFNELRVGSDYTVSIDVPGGQMVTSGNDATARAVILIQNQPVKNFGLAPTQ